jgi:polyhydroxyalkanoate synthesis repressor PhaR
MTDQSRSAPSIIEIRKYRNRRFYDTTRSRHLTLEDIRRLIREGANVRIVDSKTEADITTKVLLQMILEFDAPKVDLFTAPLLTEIIRVNDQVIKGFFEKFFDQTLGSFLAFQRNLEKQVEGGLLPGLFPMFMPWQARSKEGNDHSKKPEMPKDEEALAQKIQSLQAQVTALQREFKRGSRSRKARKTK